MNLIPNNAPDGGQRTLAELLSRSASGDRGAFSRFYEATSGKTYGVIVRILGRGAVADEIMQEVYVNVWRRAGDYRAERASPITWLVTIARNRAIDEARRMPAPGVELTEELAPSFDQDPLAPRERSEALSALLRCLSRLETDKREAILLAYYHGVSRDALARRFGRPASTIKTWLRRSLGQLKTCMTE